MRSARVRPARAWVVALAALMVLAPGSASVAQGGSPTGDQAPEARTAAVDAVRATLRQDCLSYAAVLSIDGSAMPLMVSVGTYDRARHVGSFRSVLARQEGGAAAAKDPLVVDSRHEDGRIRLHVVRDEPSTRDAWLTSTPRELTHGDLGSDPELARLGRYQPTAAIDLLLGFDPAGVGPGAVPAQGAQGRVDLAAALAAAPTEPMVHAMADAIPVRSIPVVVTVTGPPWMLASVRYLYDVPTGSGDVAQRATWMVVIGPQVNC